MPGVEPVQYGAINFRRHKAVSLHPGFSQSGFHYPFQMGSKQKFPLSGKLEQSQRPAQGGIVVGSIYYYSQGKDELLIITRVPGSHAIVFLSHDGDIEPQCHDGMQTEYAKDINKINHVPLRSTPSGGSLPGSPVVLVLR